MFGHICCEDALYLDSIYLNGYSPRKRWFAATKSKPSKLCFWQLRSPSSPLWLASPRRRPTPTMCRETLPSTTLRCVKTITGNISCSVRFHSPLFSFLRLMTFSINNVSNCSRNCNSHFDGSNCMDFRGYDLAQWSAVDGRLHRPEQRVSRRIPVACVCMWSPYPLRKQSMGTSVLLHWFGIPSIYFISLYLLRI